MDTSKPKANNISQQANYGTIQSGTGGWDTAAPTAGGTPQVNAYSPQMLGGDAAGSSDHNSEWLDATPMD